MKIILPLMIAALLVTACETEQPASTALPLPGTWRLLSGTLIENNDTSVTDYTKGRKFLKIINDSHFSFIHHDLGKGSDSATAVFSAGAGTYELKDSTYTEHLEFCSDRNWENNSFHFTITIQNDTLVQKGVEKIEGTNVNRFNIEKYVRVKEPGK
jgi:hypothetical protein